LNWGGGGEDEINLLEDNSYSSDFSGEGVSEVQANVDKISSIHKRSSSDYLGGGGGESIQGARQSKSMEEIQEAAELDENEIQK
jgi:hypothetical protein